ncbi:MAG: carboxymuconolactone decarboxylase family protein, partial [Pseudomonadota bacterium]|nr:carboxymuconolactone decarboxylase family protein [Pseudomonadota bacterium]
MRLKNLDYSDMNQEQKKIYDDIASGPRGSVRGPLAVWMHRAGLADKAQSLGAYCRYSSSLEPLLSEFAICLIARIWASGYEWKVHSKIAIDAGVSKNTIESISLGKKPSQMSEEQHAIYEFTMSLNKDKRISDELYNKTYEILGKDRLVDLVGILGYYTLISMT